MLSTSQLIITVLVASAVTFSTRLIPFAVFGKREVPKIVKYLGNIMPPAIIGVLIVYCIKDGYTFDMKILAPQLIAIALTVIVHLWKRNILFSISVGTISYMLLIHYIFI